MGKLRSVNTKFWEDPWSEDLTPKDKLLFLYLLTNTKTNMLGIYEVSLNKISFETGLSKQDVEKSLEGFERIKKVFYIDNYIVLCNFLKNQSMNTNMKKSAIAEFEKLPLSLINTLSLNSSEGFESLSKGFLILPKVEVEVEVKIEVEIEDKKLPLPTLEIESDVNFLISLYPDTCEGRNCSTRKGGDSIKAKLKKILGKKSKEQVEASIKGYVSDCAKSKTYLLNFSKFLDELPEAVERIDPNKLDEDYVYYQWKHEPSSIARRIPVKEAKELFDNQAKANRIPKILKTLKGKNPVWNR